MWYDHAFLIFYFLLCISFISQQQYYKLKVTNGWIQQRERVVHIALCGIYFVSERWGQKTSWFGCHTCARASTQANRQCYNRTIDLFVISCMHAFLLSDQSMCVFFKEHFFFALLSLSCLFLLYGCWCVLCSWLFWNRFARHDLQGNCNAIWGVSMTPKTYP